MRRVILLRHGTAASPLGMPDEERPLTGRGRVEAEEAAAALAAQGWPPDLVLSSTAVRARQTAEAIPGAGATWVERDLYLAPAPVLRSRLQQVDDGVGVVLVVGHNPGLQQLAIDLCAEEADRAMLVGRFAPATMAVLDAAVASWDRLGTGSARLCSIHHAGV